MNLKLLSTILFSVSALMSNAQTQVTEYSPAQTAEGVVYSLPSTEITVDVSATKTVYVPGEFAKYAERYLHIQGVKRTAETQWKVDNVKVYGVGVPDTLKTFVIKQKEKSSASNVQLTKRGVLVAINTQPRIDDNILPRSASTHHALDGRKYLTSEMLEASSSAKIAELVAREIFEIRDSKNAIRRGQVESMPKDGASLRIVLDDLDVQEEALMQMFVGYTDTTLVYERFALCPKSDVNKEVLFRFSAKEGFKDTDDLSGAPYYISVADKHTVQMPTEKEASKRKINGVVYNLPSVARVTLSTMSSVLFEGDIPMGQFGTVDVLNNALFNKGMAPKVTFSPSSGALLKIE